GGVLPLANFGTISFSEAKATVGGATGPADNPWSNSTLYQTNMVTKSGALKATTSALSDSGNPATSSFSVTWVSSGSSGKGGGRKSSNAPPPRSGQPTALSAALAGLAASTRGPSTSAATQPLPTALVIAPPTVTALQTGGVIAAPSALGTTISGGDWGD